MRIIQLTIQDEALSADTTIAGQAGEHLAAALALDIPEEWQDCDCTLRFYLPFAGKYYRTVPLSNPVFFPLPQALMIPGELQVFLDARKDFVVHRTSVLHLTVEDCPDWCGMGALVADRYEGLLDSSLQEFKDALGELETLTNRLDEAEAAVESAQKASTLAQAAATTAVETVAGFEGYTKQESNSRYAYALTDTAEGTEIMVDDLQEGARFASLSLTGLCRQDTFPGPISYVGDGGTIPIIVDGQTRDIPVELYGISDGAGGFTVRDQLVINYAQNSAYVRRNVGRIVFTGEEKIVSDLTTARETSNYIYLVDYRPVANGRLLCNLLPWRPNGYDTTQSYCWTSTVISVTLLNSETGIVTGEERDTYLEKFREWFRAKAEAGTPLTIYYPLETPTEEPVNAQTKELLLSIIPQGTGTALSTGAQPHPSIALVYHKDANKTIAASLHRIQSLEELTTASVPMYGVRFAGPANSGDTVTRLYNAIGLTAGVGTDTQTAVNDFDHIYPWCARRRCCGYFDENDNFVVNAYAGEPGYATDGSNGEVWVEHSLFYYKHVYDGDAEEIVISGFPAAGFSPAPIFVNPDGTLRQKAYTAAYPMATVNGKATSRAGVFSDACSLNCAMTTARTLGESYTTTTTAEWYTECLYMWVEFATRDLQTVMRGATKLPSAGSHQATVAETATNRIIVANATAKGFAVGQTINIGTLIWGTQVVQNRVITAIDVYDTDNKAISFDGDPADIAVGNVVYCTAHINGSCDGVLSSSGSPVSNTSGLYNCMYRGTEAPYGNAYEWISDVLFRKEGAGTEDDPYMCRAYYLPDPTTYAAGMITSDYVKLPFGLPATGGWVKKLGLDSRYPHVRLPEAVGSQATAYYADNYYAPSTAVCAAAVGGYWSSLEQAGPNFWNCSWVPGSANVNCRARLSHYHGGAQNTLRHRIEALETQMVNMQIGG